MSDPDDRDALRHEMLNLRPGKWDFVIVANLKSGPLRFNALKMQIGDISQKMLASSLRELERYGFVSRTQYATIPPRVDYELTDLGRDLLAHLENGMAFVQTHRETIKAAREEFDRLHGPGADLAPKAD